MRAGARVLLDVYHSLGVFPVDVSALDVDFAVGGSYKYLRGGPARASSICIRVTSTASLRTLDIGWFAKKRAVRLRTARSAAAAAEGGDAFLESTPPVLPFYQARAGQLLALALGGDRLRVYSLALQRQLVGLLAERGIAATGGDDAHGAFCVLSLEGDGAGAAVACARALAAQGVISDARGPWLRLSPDILTSDEELRRAAATVARAIGRTPYRRSHADLPRFRQ